MDEYLMKHFENEDLWKQCREKFLKSRKEKMGELSFVMICATLLFNGFTVFWQMRDMPNIIWIMIIATVCIIFADIFIYFFTRKQYKEVSFERKIIVVDKCERQLSSLLTETVANYYIIDSFGESYECLFDSFFKQMKSGSTYAILISDKKKIYGFAEIKQKDIF